MYFPLQLKANTFTASSRSTRNRRAPSTSLPRVEARRGRRAQSTPTAPPTRRARRSRTSYRRPHQTSRSNPSNHWPSPTSSACPSTITSAGCSDSWTGGRWLGAAWGRSTVNPGTAVRWVGVGGCRVGVEGGGWRLEDSGTGGRWLWAIRGHSTVNPGTAVRWVGVGGGWWMWVW